MDPKEMAEKLAEMKKMLEEMDKELSKLRASTMQEIDQSAFDTSEWDAGEVKAGLEVGDLRKVSLMDLNGYPGQEGDPTKDLCKLPYKKTPDGKPNLAAIKACGSGARGIGAVTKPAAVPEDYFDKKRKEAARTLSAMWPKAFGKEAPMTVLRYAGKEEMKAALQAAYPVAVGNMGMGEFMDAFIGMMESVSWEIHNQSNMMLNQEITRIYERLNSLEQKILKELEYGP